MPQKRQISGADRLDAAEARIEGLAARVTQLEDDGRQVRAELAAVGITAPVINPGRKRPKLTAEQRHAILQQTARNARASKGVGSGRGAVRSSKTKRQLETEAKAPKKD